ncbi:hypothetical protein DOY81_011433 [Sarcophaga bullata]|nr:hypothetical protein DOY81_011433 [Sarcophaga bullata]
MGDEFDGCECIWTHEMAMQRLLNFVSDRIQPNTPGGEDSNFTMMTMVMIFALVMYLIRPESVLKMTTTKGRGQGPSNGNGGSNQPPPPAPPAVN